MRSKDYTASEPSLEKGGRLTVELDKVVWSAILVLNTY